MALAVIILVSRVIFSDQHQYHLDIDLSLQIDSLLGDIYGPEHENLENLGLFNHISARAL